MPSNKLIIAPKASPSGVQPLGIRYGKRVLTLLNLSTLESYAKTTYGNIVPLVDWVVRKDTVTWTLSIMDAALQMAVVAVMVRYHLSPDIELLASTVM